MKALILSLALGFIVSFVGTFFARRYLLASGIFGVDQQKRGKPKLPTSGGIVVLFGLLIAVTSFLGLSFFLEKGFDTTATLAALNSIVIITLIGLLDDIHINIKAIIEEELEIEDVKLEIYEEKERIQLPHTDFFSSREESDVLREGLGQISKMMFVLPAALPLIAVGAGSWTMHFPLIGTVNWGVLYPLILLPIGLLFVSNIINMLAGTNGLSALISLVASTALGAYALIIGETAAALIGLSLSASILGFLYYNFYPASILPGDSFTYLAGAAIFSTMVIGNMERFGVFIFAPWFLEFFLKLRSGFKARSWGILQEDGTLKPQHDKTYSLTHPLMRRGFTEKQITLVLAGAETLICVAGLIIFTQVL